MNAEGAMTSRPETLVMMLFVGVFGILIFSWASNNLMSSVKDSGERGSRAVECSEFKAEVVDINPSENSTEISFIINKEVEQVYVLAETAEGVNTTESVESPSVGDINTLDVGLTDISSVSLSTSLCDTALQ